jgi:hypothetical protein
MNWRAYKQLHNIYTDGAVPSDILKFPLIKRLSDMDYIRQSDNRTLTKTKSFDPFYVNALLPRYSEFQSFLSTHDLLDTNFKETELLSLVKIASDRVVIIETGKSQKEISTLYFGDAKAVKKGSGIYEAIIKILGVDVLARDEHDQQFLYVLHCLSLNPACIVLCENDNKIRKPRLKDVELWHAGGGNTAKLQFVPQPKIPIYYLCDWDNKGMEIYQGIKREYLPNIELLIPAGPVKMENIEKPWTVSINENLFSNEALRLLAKLIPEKWIEEESIIHPLFNG